MPCAPGGNGRWCVPADLVDVSWLFCQDLVDGCVYPCWRVEPPRNRNSILWVDMVNPTENCPQWKDETCFEFYYGGFQKWWYRQIIHFNGIFPNKPSFLGYPHDYGNPQMQPAVSRRSADQRNATSLEWWDVNPGSMISAQSISPSIPCLVCLGILVYILFKYMFLYVFVLYTE